MRRYLPYTGIAAVVVVWTTLLGATARTGFDLLGDEPLSYLGTQSRSIVLFGIGLAVPAVLLTAFHHYLRGRYPLSTGFSAAMLIGLAGQMVAAFVPIGGGSDAHRIHTVAALVLGASLPLLMWRFAAGQPTGRWRRLTYGLFWAEAAGCALGLSGVLPAPVAEIVPGSVFHAWVVLVTVAALSRPRLPGYRGGPVPAGRQPNCRTLLRSSVAWEAAMQARTSPGPPAGWRGRPGLGSWMRRGSAHRPARPGVTGRSAVTPTAPPSWPCGSGAGRGTTWSTISSRASWPSTICTGRWRPRSGGGCGGTWVPCPPASRRPPERARRSIAFGGMTSVPGDDEAPIWAIGDLNRRARHAVVREFRGQVRVGGELTRLEDRRGSRWLELVERGGGRDGRDAHLQAFCSATRWLRLQRKMAEAGVDVAPGQRLVVVGSLEIGDRGALSLTVEDVDVAALVGERLQARRQLVQRLVDDHLFDANHRLPAPVLPLRIGLVASGGSDGHRDLVRQLDASGFAFGVILRTVPVEGPLAPRAIRAALATFGAADVDVAVIVRGGGAKASLDVFDAPMVAHAIATAAVPVWTGIGHAGDRTVADEVAHRCCATPSMVGQALVTAVAGALDAMARAVARIARQVDAGLVRTAADLDGRWRAVAGLARAQLALHEQARAQGAVDVRRGALRTLDGRTGQLAVAADRIRSSGGAELRDAGRRLAGLALDTASAAHRRCADSTAELALAAGATSRAASQALGQAGTPIERAGARLAPARFDALLDTQDAVVAAAGRRARRDVHRRLDADADRAASRRAVLEAYDPGRQLGRGWTLTHTPDGCLVRRAADLAEGDRLVTTFADGAAHSTVTEVRPGRGEDQAGE